MAFRRRQGRHRRGGGPHRQRAAPRPRRLGGKAPARDGDRSRIPGGLCSDTNKSGARTASHRGRSSGGTHAARSGDALVACGNTTGWCAPALAEDAFKVAIGQLEIWSGQAPILGQRAGIFKKQGITLENFGTAGAGETVQAVISGSSDFGVTVCLSGVLLAVSKGAPIRGLGANFTGAGDIYFYVRSDSPIRSLRDTNERTTISYSTGGSTTHNIVLGLGKELGIKGVPTSTGGLPGTLTAVMSGQVDVGWGAPPFGLKEIGEGKIRVVANGNDVPSLRHQTIRVEVVNANVLSTRKDAVLRFVRAFRETLDWMYADPEAIKWYAEATKVPVAIAKTAVEKYQPKEAKQFDRILDIDGIIADAIRLKFLDAPLSKEQLAEFVQIPPRE
ncbi:MAG: ABC transporter substrate-binding protein [Hyphomicrobiales bacterium]|nr:ABC transporter substrate-binding protein [Hyphomicrobiales bacterium]